MIRRRFHGIDLPHPLFKSMAGSVQGSTVVHTQDLGGFLKLLLAGLRVFHVVVIVAVFVAASGRPLRFPLLVLAAALPLAGPLRARSTAASLGPLLVAPFVLGLLQPNE